MQIGPLYIDTTLAIIIGGVIGLLAATAFAVLRPKRPRK